MRNKSKYNKFRYIGFISRNNVIGMSYIKVKLLKKKVYNKGTRQIVSLPVYQKHVRLKV